MPQRIRAFLAQKRIAIVGVSRTRGFGNTILETLRARGYSAFAHD